MVVKELTEKQKEKRRLKNRRKKMRRKLKKQEKKNLEFINSLGNDKSWHNIECNIIKNKKINKIVLIERIDDNKIWDEYVNPVILNKKEKFWNGCEWI